MSFPAITSNLKNVIFILNKTNTISNQFLAELRDVVI
ncbi:MAG: hypothetical protein JWQ84_427 [Mucilaginibacter sp.]|nr:hypothetical protein [Mucilaginibacter sp.]